MAKYRTRPMSIEEFLAPLKLTRTQLIELRKLYPPEKYYKTLTAKDVIEDMKYINKLRRKPLS